MGFFVQGARNDVLRSLTVHNEDGLIHVRWKTNRKMNLLLDSTEALQLYVDLERELGINHLGIVPNVPAVDEEPPEDPPMSAEEVREFIGRSPDTL